ncbi:hypothetical protein [Persicirhabdus sediminis]|uniref:Uncharacterized protein n=1 Tax=Persicirhabdus sediminis TaxID=454144 RepID=A0A8J7SKQ6_9BACT|nr:hypothetical protein [Persicirhabdus sediminis]MBK1792254.1 hypothetical protein [Persicirhabdus sediminis]
MAGDLGEKAAEKPEKTEVVSAEMIVDKGIMVKLAEKCRAFFAAFFSGISPAEGMAKCQPCAMA